MTPGADRVAIQQFVVAVRERHDGPASDEALASRLDLAALYLEGDRPVDAIEVLLGAAIDAHRLYGPTDDRSIRTRLRLGDAYQAADRPFDACGVYENLRADVRAARSADDPVLHEVFAIADSAYAALEAEHGPLQ